MCLYAHYYEELPHNNISHTRSTPDLDFIPRGGDWVASGPDKTKKLLSSRARKARGQLPCVGRRQVDKRGELECQIAASQVREFNSFFFFHVHHDYYLRPQWACPYNYIVGKMVPAVDLFCGDIVISFSLALAAARVERQAGVTFQDQSHARCLIKFEKTSPRMGTDPRLVYTLCKRG